MKKRFSIYSVFLCALLFAGCTAHRGTVSSYQNIPSPDPSSQLPSVADKSGENTSSRQDLLPESAAVKKEAIKVSANGVLVENGERGQNFLDTALDMVQEAQEYWSKGELQNAIENLDNAYTLVMSVDTEDHPDLIQQQEDLRFMISKRILEIYASRYTAVDGNHNAIPLIMNKHVEKEIRLFQTNERKFFLASYNRSGRFRKRIVASLKEAGLPEELSWLPLIESGFKVNALSRARALGLWQFIPSTGYKFGLKRDNWIDERLDPEKATRAAIEYLEELHNIFGDWTTVLAGYNCGEGRVLRVIRDQQINYLDNFWDLYEKLPRETARYVPRFLATLHILNDPEKYGFELDEPEHPIAYETMNIQKQVELKKLSSFLDVSSHEMNLLNPELRWKVTPPTLYTLRIPHGKREVLLAQLDSIPKWSPPEKAFVYHRVRSGETLSRIAQKYRTSVRSIVRANGIRQKHLIRVGQKLKVPLKSSSSRVYASKPKLLPNGKYRIKKGDTLWLIAKKFNTNTKTLMRMNNLRTTRLYVGQTLKIAN
jgi:membrane-bound lytic murein transglycosylase D